MSDRWKMNRIGFVNFWLYDEEDFEFDDENFCCVVRMVPENPLPLRVLFRLYLTEIEHPADWTLLVPVTGEWNIIFWVRKEEMMQLVTCFWNLKGRYRGVQDDRNRTAVQSAENRWTSGDLCS